MTPIATFRSQFIFTFRSLMRIVIPSGCAFGLLLVWMFVVPRPIGLAMNWQFAQIVWEACRVGSLVGMALLLTSIALVTWYATITVYDSGLHAYGFWGDYHTVEWNEMVSVQSRNLLGLPYVCVNLNGTTSSLWIPRFLRDHDKFRELVRDYAGEDHPLYRELIANG